MTRDEIVTALRQCPRYGVDCSKGVCAFFKPNGAFEDCIKKKNDAAADLIENQQRHIEALLQANADATDKAVFAHNIQSDVTMDIIRENIGKIKEMLEENDNG